MVPPAKEEDMMVLPKQLIEFIPRLHLARSLDKKDDLNADPDRGERCRNILWLCDLDESQLLDRMNKYHKDLSFDKNDIELKVVPAVRDSILNVYRNDFVLTDEQLNNLHIESCKDLSFYKNDIELKVVSAVRDVILSVYRNNFVFMDEQVNNLHIESCKDLYFYIRGNGNELEDARDLVMEQYKEALGHIMRIHPTTFTNSIRVETIAALNSCPTDGEPMHLVLDSGASSHVVGNRDCLRGYQLLANPRMGILPDKSMVSIVGVGTIQTEDFSITNVSHVEGLAMNLISVSQLDKNYGMGSWFLRGQCGIMLPDGTTAGEGTLENGVYVLRKLHVPAGPVMEA